jgi:N-acetyl sugar amidotransferase
VSVSWCRQCLMPNTRPRMIIGDDGICPACKWAEAKRNIDWYEREQQFRALLAQHAGRGAYDCIVPFSGGKDSAVIAWRLKHEYGLRPLLVCYGQLLWTDVGRYNFHQVANAGFDIVYWRTDQVVSRKLARRFLIERGHPKVHYDAAINAVPVREAVEKGIPLVIYAEHGETEYGGRVLSEESQRTRDLTEILENHVGDDARNWATDGISERELHPYIYPDLDDIHRVGVKAFYFSYFHKWSVYENALIARDKLDFRWCRPRSDGSFEGWDSIDDKIDGTDFWLMHLKFLFGRSTRMASRMIQNGHMTREEGLRLVREYDGEFPEMYLPEVLEYVGMTRAEFIALADKHRNPELWTKENGEWVPRYRVS